MPAPEPARLPFSPEWQRLFAHLLIEDDRFADVVGEYVEPKFFDGEAERWLWATALEHKRRYNAIPSWVPLSEAARKLDPQFRDNVSIGLDQIRNAPTRDAEWVRATAIEWVRRNVFVRAFRNSQDIYNQGRFEAAYDALMSQMDRFQEIAIVHSTADETWLAEDFVKRQGQRYDRLSQNTVTGIGIPEIDSLLGGGLDRGQFGLWMSWSKVGKTSMLINNGKIACRTYNRNVAHFFFEGSLEQITNRYDASFSGELYAAVKRGEWGSGKYELLFREYSMLKRKCYIKGFPDQWNCSVTDIWDVLQRLKRQQGWEPDVVIVDYADLLEGRGNQEDGYASNAAAFRDLKTLTTKGRGYALWSAAQAKKPKDADYDTKPSLLKSSDLGGRYEKVKVVDFLASLNATLEERAVLGKMRIWVEAVRDSPAGIEIPIACDYARMVFGAGAGLGGSMTPAQPATGHMPPMPAGRRPAPFGYHQTSPNA